MGLRSAKQLGNVPGRDPVGSRPLVEGGSIEQAACLPSRDCRDGVRGLGKGGQAEGWGAPQQRVPLRRPVDRRRAFTKFARTRVLLEVGFIDRFSGDHLFGEGPWAGSLR